MTYDRKKHLDLLRVCRLRALVLIFFSGFFYSNLFINTAAADNITDHPIVSEWLLKIDFPFEKFELEAEEISLPAARIPDVEALIISNSKYDNFSRLDSVVADRKIAEKAFRKSKFNTTKITEFTDVASFFNNLRKGPAVSRRKKGFLNEIEEGDVVILYYSGHGFQYGTETYLVPTNMANKDIQIDRISKHAVPLNAVLNDIYSQYPSYVFVIFDACRTVPTFLINRDNNKIPLKGNFSSYKEQDSWNKKYPNTYIAFASQSSYPAESSGTSKIPSPYTDIFYSVFDPNIPVNNLVSKVNAHVRTKLNREAEGTNKTGTVTALRLPLDDDSKKTRKGLWLTTLLSAIGQLSEGDIAEANSIVDLYLNEYSTHEYSRQAQFIRDANLFEYSQAFRGQTETTLASSINFSEAVQKLDRQHGRVSAVIQNIPVDRQEARRVNPKKLASFFCFSEYQLETTIDSGVKNSFSNFDEDVQKALAEIQLTRSGDGNPNNYSRREAVPYGNPDHNLVLLNLNHAKTNIDELAYLNRLRELSKIFEDIGFITAGTLNELSDLQWQKDGEIEITICSLRSPHGSVSATLGVQTSDETINLVRQNQMETNLPPKFDRKLYSFAAPGRQSLNLFGYEINY